MTLLMSIAGCHAERGDTAAATKALNQCIPLMLMDDMPVLELALGHFAASRYAEPMESLAAFVAKRAGAKACRLMLAEMEKRGA
jgi:hypothetical protein